MVFDPTKFDSRTFSDASGRMPARTTLTPAQPAESLIVVTDAKGFITLHEPNEDSEAGDLVASVWRDDWLGRLAKGAEA